jgi:hypothetical protein
LILKRKFLCRAGTALLAVTTPLAALADPVSAAVERAGAPAIPAYDAAGAPACNGADGYAAAFGGRRTLRWRPDWLADVKTRIGRGDPALAPAYRALLARADAALNGGTYTVTAKGVAPPSGDRHDYWSIGPYWWPDPDHPNGPYVRRDGHINPGRDSADFDTTRLTQMSTAVESLALAYYFTGDRRYAQKASTLLRVWFLDPATRMNPNANFAQGVPGRTPGRAEGVLDTYRLLPVVEAIGLLAPSATLGMQEQAGLEKWFGDYTQWMATSTNGKAEHAATNNHGLWYLYQFAEYALFARRADLARAAIAEARERIPREIEQDGKLPLELKRTRALHYSVFALQALAGAADLGRCFGSDLWRFESPDGRGMHKAIDFIAAYVGRESQFPYPELNPGETVENLDLLSDASQAYRDPNLGRKAAELARRNQDDVLNLIIPPYR